MASVPAYTSRALETIEAVLAALRQLDDSDRAVEDLIAALETDRALLVAQLVGDQAVGRPPSRFRSPVGYPSLPQRRSD